MSMQSAADCSIRNCSNITRKNTALLPTVTKAVEL